MRAQELKAEAAALEARVEARKSNPSVFQKSSPVVSMSEVIPEVMETLEAMRQRSADFCKLLEPEIAEHPELEACEIHPDHLRPIDREATQLASWRDEGHLVLVREICPLCQAAEELRKFNHRFVTMGAPERVCHATMDNYEIYDNKQSAALSAAERFLKKKRGFLVLVGTAGTGKSHLACAVFKELGGGKFVTQRELLSGLRETYSNKKSREDFYAPYKNCRVLVVDEIGLSEGGADEQPMLYEILAFRHDRNKPTVLCSNFGFETVAKALGERLTDRIAECNEKASCEWQSYRRRNADNPFG